MNDYLVTMPDSATELQWEAISAAAARYREDPSVENHRILTGLGATITRVPYRPKPPKRPALVRRAMALHR